MRSVRQRHTVSTWALSWLLVCASSACDSSSTNTHDAGDSPEAGWTAENPSSSSTFVSLRLQPSCARGRQRCGEECVDLYIDPNHCGSCETTCMDADQAFGACIAGTCAIAACMTPYDDCNHEATDGCEVNTDTDPMHCSECGQTCELLNATPACRDGHCAIGTCDANFADCNSVAGDGCEAFLLEEPNCGACDNPCLPGQRCVERDLCRVIARLHGKEPITLCTTQIACEWD